MQILFFCSKYLAKIDTIHQKQQRSMHYNATKTSQIHANHTSKKQQSTSNPHQNQAKSHKMGWVCSQKLTLSPHPDKPSHYLLWPLLVFELTPPLLSKKPAPHQAPRAPPHLASPATRTCSCRKVALL